MGHVTDGRSNRTGGAALGEKRAASKSLGQALADFVFGYDFFISYAWSDGRAFAASLEKQLKQRGFDCFLDSTDYASGDNWDLVGQRAIRKTTSLILVGTEGAVRSEPVQLKFLRCCLTSDDSPCRAIATVRSDFLSNIQAHKELVAWNEHTQFFRLDLLKKERLFDIVRRPAELVDVRFEDDALVRPIQGRGLTGKSNKPTSRENESSASALREVPRRTFPET